jgi:hypothetical protein
MGPHRRRVPPGGCEPDTIRVFVHITSSVGARRELPEPLQTVGTSRSLLIPSTWNGTRCGHTGDDDRISSGVDQSTVAYKTTCGTPRITERIQGTDLLRVEIQFDGPCDVPIDGESVVFAKQDGG